MVIYLPNTSKTDPKFSHCLFWSGGPTSSTPRPNSSTHRCRRALRGKTNLRSPHCLLTSVCQLAPPCAGIPQAH
eukprot:3046182-Pyramimonas_sp.AAC.1